MKKPRKHYKTSNLFIPVFLGTIFLAYTVSITPIQAQQIVPDGNTSTNLSINGNITTVTTSTIKIATHLTHLAVLMYTPKHSKFDRSFSSK